MPVAKLVPVSWTTDGFRGSKRIKANLGGLGSSTKRIVQKYNSNKEISKENPNTSKKDKKGVYN